MILYVVRSQRPLQYVRVISDEVMQERGYGFWFTDDVLADASTESYVVDGGELSDYKGQFLFRHLIPACKEHKEPFGGRAYFEVLVPGKDFKPPQMIPRTYLNWRDFFTAGVPSQVLDRFEQSAAGVMWSGPAQQPPPLSLSTPSHAQGWGPCGGLVPVELRACRTHVGPPPLPSHTQVRRGPWRQVGHLGGGLPQGLVRLNPATRGQLPPEQQEGHHAPDHAKLQRHAHHQALQPPV